MSTHYEWEIFMWTLQDSVFWGLRRSLKPFLPMNLNCDLGQVMQVASSCNP